MLFRSRVGRPRRGRPRSTHADRVILVAAAEVMAEKGIGGLSIEEVAVRAGVGKTTIYRRWSSRGTLALDAFLAEFDGQQGLPDTGTFAGDLRAALGAWVRAVSGTSAGNMLVGLIAEMQHDRNLAVGWQDQVIAPLRAQYSIILDRGVTRGEIPAETDAGIVLDLLFGACYYRLLQGQRPPTEQFVNQIVDVVAAGARARTELPDRAHQVQYGKHRHRSSADQRDRPGRNKPEQTASANDGQPGDSEQAKQPADAYGDRVVVPGGQVHDQDLGQVAEFRHQNHHEAGQRHPHERQRGLPFGPGNLFGLLPAADQQHSPGTEQHGYDHR